MIQTCEKEHYFNRSKEINILQLKINDIHKMFQSIFIDLTKLNTLKISFYNKIISFINQQRKKKGTSKDHYAIVCFLYEYGKKEEEVYS